MALQSVAVLLQEPVSLFEYGVLAEVFGLDRTDEGVPPSTTALRRGPGPARRPQRHDRDGAPGLEAAADADLIAVPASSEAASPPRPSSSCCAAVERGAWVCRCAGAFTLGAAGVLDDRDCTRTGATPRSSRSCTRRRA